LEPGRPWRVSLAELLDGENRKRRHAVWITLFTIVIGIALCFALGAVAVESHEENARS